jgi:uncharacterized membrane protein
MSTVRVSRRWAVATGVYAAAIATLTWSWGSSPGGFKPAEAATFVLLLPTAVVTLPITYVVLSTVWNATGSSVDQGVVPTGIIAAYVVWFALLAIGNAVVLTVGYGVLRRRRGRQPGNESAVSGRPTPASPSKR